MDGKTVFNSSLCRKDRLLYSCVLLVYVSRLRRSRGFVLEHLFHLRQINTNILPHLHSGNSLHFHFKVPTLIQVGYFLSRLDLRGLFWDPICKNRDSTYNYVSSISCPIIIWSPGILIPSFQGRFQMYAIKSLSQCNTINNQCIKKIKIRLCVSMI